MYETLALFAVFVLIYSSVAGAVERTWISGPIVFTLFGLLVGPVGFDLLSMETDREMIIPQLTYLTNDSWEVVSALDDSNGWPLLHRADYSEGQLFVLTVPDNFIDLYRMPEGVLNRIRQDVAGSLETLLEGPGEVSIFLYDNASFVLESFLDEEQTVRVLMDPAVRELTDVRSGEKIQGKQRIAPEFMGRKFGKDYAVFELEIKAHSFRAFSF